MKKISSSQITPEHIYQSRREFLKLIGFAAGSAALASCAVNLGENNQSTMEGTAPAETGSSFEEVKPTGAAEVEPFASMPTDDLGNELTRYEDVINYNNYYEFNLNKGAVASSSKDFPFSPWEIEVSGFVNKPKIFTMEDIYSLFEEEERIYRMRCVETWTMIIPWLGFPLRKLIEMVEPTTDAKYVYFETIVDKEHMPQTNRGNFEFPYVEGLRLDEAMNDLTILSTGLYGKQLLPQNGAPIRLVVPWKYGFKSIKSIVKIKLVKDMPLTFWNSYAPKEYGFYANVNPDVPHPRWSQVTETLVGSGINRMDTLLFNGYEEEVTNLYEGMDLTKWF